MPIREKLLLVGGDTNAQLFIKEVQKGIIKTTEIVGIIDNNISKGKEVDAVPVLGKIIDLPEVAKEHHITGIVQTSHFEQAMNLIMFCRANKINYKMIPLIAGVYAKNLKEERKGSLILLNLRNTPLSGLNLAVKRTLDIIGSLILTIILSPVFLVIAILLKIENLKAPVFVKENRYNGLKDKNFKMFRFRTLPKGEEETALKYNYDEVPKHLAEIRDDKRASKLGRFFRKTKISELPQLFNVILGDMSLIGPRPPYSREVRQYEDALKKRLLVTPGMTGLWQVQRKEKLSFEDMFDLDSFYVENWSFWLDLSILFKTIKKILKFKG